MSDYPIETKKEFEEKDWKDLTNSLKKLADAMSEVDLIRKKNLTKSLNVLALQTSGDPRNYQAVADLLAKDPEKQRLFLAIIAINRRAYELTKHDSEFSELVIQITNILGKTLINS